MQGSFLYVGAMLRFLKGIRFCSSSGKAKILSSSNIFSVQFKPDAEMGQKKVPYKGFISKINYCKHVLLYNFPIFVSGKNFRIFGRATYCYPNL